MKTSTKYLLFIALAMALCGPVGFPRITQSTQPSTVDEPSPGSEPLFTIVLIPVQDTVKLGRPSR